MYKPLSNDWAESFTYRSLFAVRLATIFSKMPLTIMVTLLVTPCSFKVALPCDGFGYKIAWSNSIDTRSVIVPDTIYQ